MTEPLTTVGGAAIIAYLSKDGISKLLGPTAEYLGGELKDLVQKSQANIFSVFQKAEKKCGDRINQKGAVNPRVLKHIYDEARFCENELLSEYFGGVLASARTESGEDDRGVYYSQIVKSSSIYQLRCHYLFYYIMWHYAKNKSLDLYLQENRDKLTILVPVECYFSTFNITNSRDEFNYIAHSLSGLAQTNLISESFQFSHPSVLKKFGVDCDQHSFVIEPSLTGLELFVWVHGMGESGINSFCNEDLIINPDLEIKHIEKAKLITS